jgi:hypothetical protein
MANQGMLGDRPTSAVVGLVLMGAGAAALWDAYTRRGARPPLALRLAAGLAVAWW